MVVGGKVVLQVQWIEMAFNASGDSKCAATKPLLCSIDKTVGTPVVAMGVRN